MEPIEIQHFINSLPYNFYVSTTSEPKTDKYNNLITLLQKKIKSRIIQSINTINFSDSFKVGYAKHSFCQRVCRILCVKSQISRFWKLAAGLDTTFGTYKHFACGAIIIQEFLCKCLKYQPFSTSCIFINWLPQSFNLKICWVVDQQWCMHLFLSP